MTLTLTSPEAVAALFSQDGGYRFARWGRPIVPVIFGVEEATLRVFKGAIEGVVALAGHRMADHDPELGANLMIFFCRDWAELAEVPNLDRLIDGLPALLGRLEQARANQYRTFRLDPEGAIRAVFVFLRVDAALAEIPAADLALDQAARMICLWAPGAFGDGVLATADKVTVLHPDAAALIRAAYDPVLPAATQDAAHALRLFARLGR